MMQKTDHIILYDGECGLCSRTVRFIRARDKKQIFGYVPLQSEDARQIAGSETIMITDLNTVIYIANGRFYYRSEAAIRVLMKIGGFYTLSAVFLIIPKRVRDSIYNYVAVNRHRWFGKEEHCSL
jgi:predicted DCC family thiol-disulfide oxidoreductase YuxK